MTVGRSRWRGRILALVGIVLCAFSLRSAVASLSPMYDLIQADFPLSSATIGLIGTLPPLCFAVFGFVTPMLERAVGLERLTIVALAVIATGLVGRGFSPDATGLVMWTAVVFAGVGVGNILLPPLVKKYFPDRIGLMMTLYTTSMAVSTFLPPMVAVPVADAAGWRFSLGLWGAFAIAGLIPWLAMLWQGRGAERSPEETATGPIPIAPQNRAVFARLIRIPLVWALMAVFATSSATAYVTFAWFPTILMDISGVDAATAGFLLSLFALLALPVSLLVPILAVRFQATRALFFIGVAGGVTGLSGFLLAPLPSLLWLWTTLFGLVGTLFPLALVLISIRSRTPESAVLLSSFVQSVGYVGVAGFPLMIGVIHDASGSWTIPLLILIAVFVLAMPAGFLAGRRTTVEEEWERRHGAW